MTGGGAILVTGAGGFIGGHLVRRLAAAGHDVRAVIGRSGRRQGVDLPWCGAMRNRVETIEGDLAAREFVASAMAGVGAVVHLAGATGPEDAQDGMHPLFESNVAAAFNLLEAARAGGAIERFVCTSTCSVYGPNGTDPLDENSRRRAGSVYSATKIAAETLAESYVRSTGLPVVLLRLFNVYGPHQTSRAVIPTIVRQVLEGERLRLGNVDARRDFTHVDDIVDCYMAVLEAPVQSVAGETFNVGTGKATSIGEVAGAIQAAAGSSLTVEVDPARVRSRTIDADVVHADNGKAARVLGWRPRVELRDGLAGVVDWWRARMGA